MKQNIREVIPETHKVLLEKWRENKRAFLDTAKDLLIRCPFHEIIDVNSVPLIFDSAVNLVYKDGIGEVAHLYLTFTRKNLGCGDDWVLERIREAIKEVYPTASKLRFVCYHGDERTYDAYIAYMI